MRSHRVSICLILAWLAMLPVGAVAQDVLPFPDPPMGGKVGPTMQQSVHTWREQPRRHQDQNEPTTGRQDPETAIGAYHGLCPGKHL